MKAALKIINQLAADGVITDYALGGATALLFYTEPALTFDVDIFIFLPDNQCSRALTDLGPLYKVLQAQGYAAEKEHVMIEGVPILFIPVYNSLVQEAVKQAAAREFDGVSIKVITIEYLLAILIDTNRPKDRERIGKLLYEINFDQSLLTSLLKQYGLLDRWEKHFANK